MSNDQWPSKWLYCSGWGVEPQFQHFNRNSDIFTSILTMQVNEWSTLRYAIRTCLGQMERNWMNILDTNLPAWCANCGVNLLPPQILPSGWFRYSEIHRTIHLNLAAVHGWNRGFQLFNLTLRGWCSILVHFGRKCTLRFNCTEANQAWKSATVTYWK